MESAPPLPLSDLKFMINESFDHTSRQLQNIDKNLLFGSFVSIFIALSVSWQLTIIAYWIPASFLLMYLWGIWSLITTRKTIKSDNVEQAVEKVKRVTEKDFSFYLRMLLDNLKPIVLSVCVIYVITIALLFLVETGLIITANPYSIAIPVIAALIFIIPALSFDSLMKNFEQMTLFAFRFLAHHADRDQESHEWSTGISSVTSLVLTCLYLPLLGVLPLCAFFITVGSKLNIYLVFVLFLQIITIAILTSYFSSVFVKKELTNALTNYADLIGLINGMIINNEYDEEAAKRLSKIYLTSKNYDFMIVDTLKFVNWYLLIPNRANLKWR
ncbi:hypothetical protein [Methanoculleus thermophilus]|uniref:Uncharacterized protein n=1 Tax=Methanoculleus thermophilus TaxID=2200 RepID=A0A1G9B0L4_9EURY|nr:hypothetical protein [Methanoculleus thermophilus]SDK33109.1 hypothetical protein SAMN04488571_107131 [Methanoculleus thermophilus]